MLDSDKGQAYLPNVAADVFVRDNAFNPNEEHMGSSTFGDATPASTIGPALPQNINRAGSGRVRGDGRA